jgi:hypothetical protein
MKRRLLWLFGGALILLLAVLFAGVYLAFGGKLPSAGPAQPTDTVKVLVPSDGVVALTLADLRGAGLEVEHLDPATLSLTSGGVDVPFFVAGDRLIFYGQGLREPEIRYAADNVYWLHVGQGAGLLMPERAVSAFPQGLVVLPDAAIGRARFEENHLFQAMTPAGEDPWLWAQLFAGSSITQSFDLSGVADGAGTLVVQLVSGTDTPEAPDHHLIVRVNGTVLGEDRWDGIVRRAITLTVPAGVLREGPNSLVLYAPGDTGAGVEQEYLDDFELAYRRTLALNGEQLAWESADRASASPAGSAYALQGTGADSVLLDVSDPARPVRLTGAAAQGGGLAFGDRGGSRYVVARPDARSGARVVPARRPALAPEPGGADYLVVAPAAFADALQPLLDWRAQQGLAVRRVALEDVFDAYGHGLPTPGALRAFLRAARPRYVLLVGDASYDERDFTGGKNKNLLPTQLVYTAHSGQTASDVWYTLDDQGKPLFALGRLPAGTSEQVVTIVDKIKAYEGAPPESWQRRVLLVADNEPEFHDVTDNLANAIMPKDAQVQKLFFGGADVPGPAAHEQIMAALNDGVAIVNYVGHGSLDVWGDEKVFQTADVPGLTNGTRLPLLVTYTCLNGFFHHPDATSLSETLLWHEGGGIVGAVVPSGRSYTIYQRPLMDDFYRTLFSQTGDARLGDALEHAQAALPQGAGFDDVRFTFNLLGDPALRFAGFKAP